MSDDTPTEAFRPGGEDAPTRRLPQQSDTPTERFGAPADPPPARTPGSDAPTEFIPTAGPAAGAGAGAGGMLPPLGPPTPPGGSGEPPKKSRGFIIAIIVLGVLLLVALGTILFTVFAGGDDEPTPSASPTATASTTPTPTATPTVTPTPTPTATATPTATPTATSTPTATPTPTTAPSATPTAEAEFTSFSPEDEGIVSCDTETQQHGLEFSWTSTGADQAWFASGTENAAENPEAEVDPSGSYNSATYDCSLESRIFTVSLDNGAGEFTHHTVLLQRVLSSN
jgi:cell division septation protein DedD